MRSDRTTLLVVLALLACAGTATAAAAATAPTGGVAAQPGARTPGTPAARSPTGPGAHHANLASWFGPGFYGNRTACGQTMSPTIVGVANRTLPCGTLVKFAYRGHTLTVPVVDRGPYAKGVEWDLTAGAAQELGLQETVKVGTRVVGQTTNTPTLGVPAGELSPPSPVAGGTAAP